MAQSNIRRALEGAGLVGGAVAVAAMLAAGCGGGGHGGGRPVGPTGGTFNPSNVELGVPTAQKGVTVFPETTAAQDGEDREVFTGQANGWDLHPDFAVMDGGDDQLDGSMHLDVNGVSFPMDQTYGELTWLTPDLTEGDGVKPAAVVDTAVQQPLEGTFIAIFGSAESRLEQTIDLSTAGTNVTLTWQTVNEPQTGYMINPDAEGYFRVVIRSQAGADLTGDISGSSTGFALDDPSFRTGPITISFQTRGITFRRDRQYFGLDAVSATDGTTQFVANGGFESGDFASWSVDLVTALQNVQSGARVLGSVRVTRSFYTQPDQLWGRWVDVYENLQSTRLDVTAAYRTDLGSDFGGIIYRTPGTGGEGLTTWDNGKGSLNQQGEININSEDRDVGFVFGRVSTLSFRSATSLDALDGDEMVTWSYNFSLEPGQKATIINFAVLNGFDTGRTATSVADHATDMDAEVQRISTGVRTEGEFSRGLTVEQLSTVINY